MKGYRYGKNWIPFSKVDEAQMKLQTEKSLKVLAFVRSNKVGDAHSAAHTPRAHTHTWLIHRFLAITS